MYAAALTVNPELLGCVIVIVGDLHGVNSIVFAFTSDPQELETESETVLTPATSVSVAFSWPLLKLNGTPTPFNKRAIWFTLVTF